jgi:serine/threonine protein phosphatase PrpC
MRILKKLSQPEVPPAETVMDALVGGPEIAQTDREILNNIADPQPEAPRDPDAFMSTMEQAAAQGVTLGQEDKRQKDAQEIRDKQEARDMAQELDASGHPIFSNIVNPDVDHSPAPVPERGTTQFVQDLEATAQQGTADGAAIRAQREAEEAAAAALAEAQRQAENAEMRRKIDSAGFKIPGLAEDATEDEKRAARAAYVAQMMENTKAGLDQVAWQREQDHVPLDGTPQGQVKIDPETGTIINPHKRAEPEPVYTTRVDAEAAALAQREPWELTDRERRLIEPGLALPLISSRAEQAELFGFDVADPTEWPGGRKEMIAFQNAMADAITHFDQAIATPANGHDERKKLNLPFTADARTPGGGFSPDSYFNKKHGMVIIDAVREGVDKALASHGPPEYANNELRAFMVKSLETAVRIKKLQADITKTKSKIASNKPIADKEPEGKKNGARSVVERNKLVLAATRKKLSEELEKSADLMKQIAETRATVEKHRRDHHIETRTGVVSLDPVTGELIKKPDGYSESIRTTQNLEASPPSPSVQEAPVVAASAPEETLNTAPSPEPNVKPESTEKEPIPGGEFVSAGQSHRGGKPDAADEDAIFSGSGLHLGEIGGTKDKQITDDRERAANLATILNELDIPDATAESVQAIWDKIDQLKKEGKTGSLDIVLDGMGGHGAGEVASSLGMFAIVQEVANSASAENAQLNGETVRRAIVKANELIKKYNEKKGSNSGFTAIVALTTPDGRTIMGSIGDARAYRIEPDGTTSMITRDHSTVFRSMVSGLTEPSGIFKHPLKNQIYRAVDGNLNPNAIEIYEGDDYNLQQGEKLLLVCDGVWESAFSQSRGGLDASTEDILKDIDEAYRRENVELNQKFLNPDQQADKEAAREQLHMKYQGEIMRRVMLAGHEQDAPAEMAKHLTRETAGMIAGDNISAVVLERKTPSPAPEAATPDSSTARSPLDDPDWLADKTQVVMNADGTVHEVASAAANPAEAAPAEPPVDAAAKATTKTTEQEADEREQSITKELVEAKCVATTAGSVGLMVDSGKKLYDINEKYLASMRKNVKAAEQGNMQFNNAAVDVFNAQQALKSLNAEQAKKNIANIMMEIQGEADPERRAQRAEDAKKFVNTVHKVLINRISGLREARVRATLQASETPINQDQFPTPDIAKTIKEQVDMYDQTATKAEQDLMAALEAQRSEAIQSIDALVNIDETVAAEKKAAREDDTRTAAEIAAETAMAAAAIDKLLGGDKTVDADEKAEIRKGLIDFLKNSKMKAPLFIAAIVVMGITGIMRSGMASRRGRY